MNPYYNFKFAIATFGPWTRGQSNKKFGTSDVHAGIIGQTEEVRHT